MHGHHTKKIENNPMCRSIFWHANVACATRDVRFWLSDELSLSGISSTTQNVWHPSASSNARPQRRHDSIGVKRIRTFTSMVQRPTQNTSRLVRDKIN
jgi:hypothetical protein